MTAVPQLVSLTEIGEALGISVQAAWNLPARHPDFPAPYRARRRSRLWWEEDVRAWAKAHGRKWKPEGDGQSCVGAAAR